MATIPITAFLWRQRGASLIEVLVSVLILSFGLLSLGAMLGYSVQAPKLAVNRAIAANIASDYIDRIRANPAGFKNKNYQVNSSYTGETQAIALNNCTYPDCTATTLAQMDIAVIQRAARQELPAGGVLMKCESDCNELDNANLWVIWQEAESAAKLSAAGSDACPSEVTDNFTNPAPRCLYVRFKL